MARRQAISSTFSLVIVFFNLLFAETKKPSCAACLSTARAVERALSGSTGDEDSQHHQQQRRRGRSFPNFTSEPAVAAALAQTCNEVRFFFFFFFCFFFFVSSPFLFPRSLFFN